MPQLSVVVPIHNEEHNLRPLVADIIAALEPMRRPFEILLVDDGSTDGSAAVLGELEVGDPRVRGLRLAGNFGQTAALCAGFQHARGKIVLTLDGDRQNDPADLPELVSLLESGRYRAVSGWRRERHDAYFRRVLPSQAANRLIAWVTGIPSRDNGCSLKAYRADLVRDLSLPRGMHRFLPAILGITSEDFGQVPVRHHPRQSGRSHYGLSRLFIVLRDLLALPYIMRKRVEVGLRWMDALSLLGGLIVVSAILAVLSHHRRMGAILEVPGLSLLAYAQLVRYNLARWLEAQARGTYRLLSAGTSGESSPTTGISPGSNQKVTT